MTQSRVGVAGYRARLRVVRRYASGFGAADGYDARKIGEWSGARKAAVTRYYDDILRLTSGPTYFYRPKIKSRKKAAAVALDQGSMRRMKGVIIPTTTETNKAGEVVPRRPHIKVKGDFVSVRLGRVTRTLLPFSAFGFSGADIATDLTGVIVAVIRSTNFRGYGIMTGAHALTAGDGSTRVMRPDDVADVAERLSNRYRNFGGWLLGLIGFDFGTVTDLREYRNREKDYKDLRREFSMSINRQREIINDADQYISKVNAQHRVTRKNQHLIKRWLTEAISNYLESPRPSMPLVADMSGRRKTIRVGDPFTEREKEFITKHHRRKIQTAEREIKNLIIERARG